MKTKYAKFLEELQSIVCSSQVPTSTKLLALSNMLGSESRATPRTRKARGLVAAKLVILGDAVATLTKQFAAEVG